MKNPLWETDSYVRPKPDPSSLILSFSSTSTEPMNEEAPGQESSASDRVTDCQIILPYCYLLSVVRDLGNIKSESAEDIS